MNPFRMASCFQFVRIAALLTLLALNAAVANGQAPVAGFSAAQTSGCVPFNVQFNNTSQNSTSWYWDFGNGNFSTAQNPVNIYLGTGSYTVKLVAYNASGQADSLIRSGYIQTISPPVVDFTSATSISCFENNAISFTNLSSGFDSCMWDFGDGNTSYQLNPVHNYTSAGLFTVTLIAYNSGLGCSASLSKNSFINILSNPSASFTANVTSLCNAQTPVIFTPQVSSANSWNWNFGDGTTSAQQQPSHVYGTPGVYTVTLITSNQLGCSDTLQQINFIEILTNPVPNILPGSLSGCAPVSAIFSSNTPGIATWSWDFGDTTSAQLPSSYHPYYNAGNYVVELEVTYANGCSNSDTVHVHVIPNPVASFQVNSFFGCSPHTATFTNTTAGTNNTYTWNFGDGTNSSQVSPTHTFTGAGIYMTSLVVVSSTGCTDSYIFPAGITVSEIDASFTADDISGCIPHTVNFNYPGGLYTYQWAFGDGTFSTQQSPSHVYQNPGSYTVTLTVANSQCSATYTYPAVVSVSDGINNFSQVTPVIACAPFTVNLYDNSPSTSGWSWDFGDGGTASVPDPVHTFTTEGTFNVTLQTQSSGSNCSQLVDPYGIYIIHAGEADFSLTQTLCEPYTATFTDNSVNAVSWLWDFGDGTTSTLQNPVHVYGAPGSYNVTLTITTADGCTYTEFYNYAVTFLPLVANATAVTADTTLPMTVNFAANSAGATSWFWEFGDGNTSSLQNPVNIYTIPGPYDISLIVSNGSCSDTISYAGVILGAGVVLPSLGNDSVHVPDPVYSCVPYEMNFTNPALNTVSWFWDFGDGITSTLENPVHIYTDPGVYTVSLITTDINGQIDTIVQPSPFYLTGSSADFQLNYANNCQGSTINTTNNSVNAVSYVWDFGDGTTSTLFQPSHVYSTVGINYIVSLSVTDSLGCTDFMARSYYAASGNSVQANTRRGCAGDSIAFTNGGMNFVSYLWDFGDGTTSTAENPTHVYPDSGSFQITLTVTDSLGCVITYNLPYPVIISKPVADFSYVINQSPCQSTVVNFTNLSTGAENYTWNFGNGHYSTLQNPTFGFTISGSHSVSLIVTTAGCSDTHTVSNFVYFPWLRVNFGYTQSSDCFPVTVTYADSSLDAVSWLWDFGDGTTSSLQNPVHVFYSEPAGPVTLTATDMYGCVRILSKPNIDVMLIAVSASDTIGCSPHLVSLSDSSYNVSSWLWDFGDGTTSTLQNPDHLYAVNGNFIVSLTATSVSGCSQTITPIAQITATGPEAQFSLNSLVSCAPTIVNFYDNSLDVVEWTWNFGDGNQSALRDPVHIYNQPGTYDVTLTVSDSAGCVDTLVRPAIVHITGSVANFSVSSTTGCSPWQVQFQDSSISAFSWSWNFGDGNVSTTQNPLHTYDTPGNYMVTLMTQDTTGCQSVYSNPVPLNVQQPPVSLFTMSDTSGCGPLTITMNNLSGTGLGYNWNFGDGTTSAAANPVHTFTNPGSYTVSLETTNSNGCADTFTATVPVVVSETPSPAFTVSTLSGCNPVAVQFTNTSLNTNANTVYIWNFGNGITYIGSDPLYVYNQAGIYTVTLTAVNNGCSATVTQNNLIVVSDGAPPPPVLLKSVSVEGETAIDVTWGNLPLTDLAAYKLYRYNDILQTFELVYADNNPNNSSFNVTSTYTDSVPGTADKSYTYIVQAINTCGNEAQLLQHIPHTSINLRDTILNNKVKLNWNIYNGCQNDGYEIYRQDNATGSFNLIGITGSNISNYTDSTVYCGMLVAYRVRAINLCGEGFYAWSDIEEIQAPGTLINQSVDVIRSTVVNDSYVFTEWSPPVQAPQLVTEFELYRSTDFVNWDLIATVPAAQTNYSDYDTHVKSRRYIYKVKVKNTCEVQNNPGLPGTSILLVGGLDENNNSLLKWSAYGDWDTGVDYYVIEKQDVHGMWVPIKTVDGNVLDYIDR